MAVTATAAVCRHIDDTKRLSTDSVTNPPPSLTHTHTHLILRRNTVPVAQCSFIGQNTTHRLCVQLQLPAKRFMRQKTALKAHTSHSLTSWRIPSAGLTAAPG